MARVGLVTALLPPDVGGTQVLVWRLFQGDPELVVVSGAAQSEPSSGGGYSALDVPTLHVPYPRLRGYNYGLAPALGVASTAWLAATLVRVTRFLRRQRVEHVVSIPHQGPFALLGVLAARLLGLRHTLYILDAWEEGSTGPVERALIRRGLRYAAGMPRSRLAVVSPALGAHYRKDFGFQDVAWIPNPSPLPSEPLAPPVEPKPFVLFTGGVKRFNIATLRCVARSILRCNVVEKLIITGHGPDLVTALAPGAEATGRIEARFCTPAEISVLQRQAAVLLVATDVGDTSHTSLGYLPGRLPEYVSTRRPILLIGPQGSDAARAVRHWQLGPTTSSLDEAELAQTFDRMARGGGAPSNGGDTSHHDLFLELFCRAESRRRLFGEWSPPLSDAAALLAAEFERPLLSS